jgi:hypothetical protein
MSILEAKTIINCYRGEDHNSDKIFFRAGDHLTADFPTTVTESEGQKVTLSDVEINGRPYVKFIGIVLEKTSFRKLTPSTSDPSNRLIAYTVVNIFLREINL